MLVIADDADVRDMLTDYLGAHGYRVRAAADAASGLAQISQLPPEIVLIDMAMPGLSGVEALPRILALAPRAAVIGEGRRRQRDRRSQRDAEHGFRDAEV